MATIHREVDLAASADFVWAALKDIGELHTRLAVGFVVDTRLAGSVRTVTFANGLIVTEQIVAIDDENKRLAYSSVGGRASHHNAYFQVFPCGEGKSRLLWVTDLLPDDMRPPIAQMVELGIPAIRQTLERAYAETV